MEDCMLTKAGSAGDQHNNALLFLHGQHIIFRFNYGLDGCDIPWGVDTHDDFVDGGLGHQKIYHNTFYGNGRIGEIRSAGVFFAGMFARIDQLNNIHDEIKGAYFAGIPTFWRQAGSSEPTDGFANEWKDGITSGNIAKMAAGNPAGSTVDVRVRLFTGADVNFTWTTVDNTWPANWTTSNVMGTSPTYQGNPQLGERTKDAFRPNGGIAQGAAVPLATANGAGTSSTQITLQPGQSKRFYDGWGMGSIGEVGDWIKIGTGAPVQILSINYGSDIMDLSGARTWANGDIIRICKTSDGINFTVCDSIGAGQVSGVVVPPAATPSLSTRLLVIR